MSTSTTSRTVGTTNPKELEAIVEQRILRDSPTAPSVERVLTQVFTEAHRCFYRDAQEDSTGNLILEGVTKSVRFDNPDRVLDRWRQPDFLQLRRERDGPPTVVWQNCNLSGHKWCPRETGFSQ